MIKARNYTCNRDRCYPLPLEKLTDLITFWVAHPEMIPNLFDADIGIAKSYLKNDINSDSLRCGKEAKPLELLLMSIFATIIETGL